MTTPLNVDISAALVSALKAVFPGRQQKKNLKAFLIPARQAFYRTMLRGEP